MDEYELRALSDTALLDHVDVVAAELQRRGTMMTTCGEFKAFRRHAAERLFSYRRHLYPAKSAANGATGSFVSAAPDAGRSAGDDVGGFASDAQS